MHFVQIQTLYKKVRKNEKKNFSLSFKYLDKINEKMKSA